MSMFVSVFTGDTLITTVLLWLCSMLAGIMLIDRNDELCILYEKANIQDEVIKGGTLEMKQRDDEVSMGAFSSEGQGHVGCNVSGNFEFQ